MIPSVAADGVMPHTTWGETLVTSNQAGTLPRFLFPIKAMTIDKWFWPASDTNALQT